MAQRTQRTTKPAVDIEHTDAFRLRWIEREMKETRFRLFGDGTDANPGDISSIHSKVDKAIFQIRLFGAIILIAGIGSKFLSDPVIEMIKKLVGL